MDSPSKTQDHIPLDIIQSIVDLVVETKHKPTLRALNAVTRHTRRLVRKHLFSEVELVINPHQKDNVHLSVERLELLHSIMEADPSLGRHVERLRLVIACWGLSNSTVSYEPISAEVLRKMTCVHTLTLESQPKNWAGWHDIQDTKLSTSIAELFKLPELREVRIVEVDAFPVHIFNLCQNLQSLVVDSSIFDPEYETSLTVSRSSRSVGLAPYKPLTALRIHARDCEDLEIIRDCLLPSTKHHGGIFSTQLLKELEITTGPSFDRDLGLYHDVPMHEFALSAHLKSLVIVPWCFRDPDFSALKQQLRHMEIKANYPHRPFKTFLYVLEAASALGMPNKLRKLVCDLGTVDPREREVDEASLALLGTTLKIAPVLKNCVIEAHFGNLDQESLGEAERLLLRNVEVHNDQVDPDADNDF